MTVALACSLVKNRCREPAYAGMRCKITCYDSVKEKEKNACFTADTATKIYHSSIRPSQTND